jgi:membrane-associated phospholipid phosphatase
MNEQLPGGTTSDRSAPHIATCQAAATETVAPQDVIVETAEAMVVTPQAEAEAAHEHPAVTLPQPPLVRLKHMIAFALSAVLSPYLVLPIGTMGIIGSVAQPTNDFLIYTAVSVFFSTVLPALFVVFQIWRGKITDVHVMEREQRGGPFLVAIFSSAIGAWVLHALGAPMEVWGILAVLTLNGIVLTWITSFWKISMHVAVLSATVGAAIIMIPQINIWPLLILIPLLMWARITRGRHTFWQGIAGTILALLITWLSLKALHFVYDVETRNAVLRALGMQR